MQKKQFQQWNWKKVRKRKNKKFFVILTDPARSRIAQNKWKKKPKNKRIKICCVSTFSPHYFFCFLLILFFWKFSCEYEIISTETCTTTTTTDCDYLTLILALTIIATTNNCVVKWCRFATPQLQLQLHNGNGNINSKSIEIDFKFLIRKLWKKRRFFGGFPLFMAWHSLAWPGLPIVKYLESFCFFVFSSVSCECVSFLIFYCNWEVRKTSSRINGIIRKAGHSTGQQQQ